MNINFDNFFEQEREYVLKNKKYSKIEIILEKDSYAPLVCLELNEEDDNFKKDSSIAILIDCLEKEANRLRTQYPMAGLLQTLFPEPSEISEENFNKKEDDK